MSSSSSSEEEEDINKVNVPITICLTIMIGYVRTSHQFQSLPLQSLIHSYVVSDTLVLVRSFLRFGSTGLFWMDVIFPLFH